MRTNYHDFTRFVGSLPCSHTVYGAASCRNKISADCSRGRVHNLLRVRSESRVHEEKAPIARRDPHFGWKALC